MNPKLTLTISKGRPDPGPTTKFHAPMNGVNAFSDHRPQTRGFNDGKRPPCNCRSRSARYIGGSSSSPVCAVWLQRILQKGANYC